MRRARATAVSTPTSVLCSRGRPRPPEAAVAPAPTNLAAEPGDAIAEDPALEVASGYLEIDQLKVYYETMGSGPPLVLIHDAARPLVPPELITQVIASLRGLREKISSTGRGSGSER